MHEECLERMCRTCLFRAFSGPCVYPEDVFSARVSGKGRDAGWTWAFGGLRQRDFREGDPFLCGRRKAGAGKQRKGVPQWSESVERIPDARVEEEGKASGCGLSGSSQERMKRPEASVLSGRKPGCRRMGLAEGAARCCLREDAAGAGGRPLIYGYAARWGCTRKAEGGRPEARSGTGKQSAAGEREEAAAVGRG